MSDSISTFTDSDGNVHTVTHTTTVDPNTGDTTITDSEQITFVHGTPDGAHPAGSSQTTFHEVVTDAQGATTTTDGVQGVDPDGNASQSASSTDSSTGLTTVVTTTVDSTGTGTSHTTMVDAAGNTVLGPDGTPLDDIEEIDEGPDDGDEEPDLVPSGTGFHPTQPGPGGLHTVNPGSHGGGGEEEDLEEDEDPFFGLDVVKAEEEDDD